MLHSLSELTRKLDRRSIIAFVFPFVLYLLTLSPTVSGHDSAELTVAAATLGFTRPTGYPAYILVGHMWSHIPIGDVGFRLNLFSAFNGALTIAILERILRRLQLDRWATFGSLGLLTSSLFFWAMSVTAEVYTLHTAFISALILCLLRWNDRLTDSRLMLFGLLVGLSLGNHMATLLFLPAIIPYLARTDVKQAVSIRTVFKVGMATLLGLCLYLYFPIKSASPPNFNYAGRYTSDGLFASIDFHSLKNIVRYATGGEFQGLMFAQDTSQIWEETRDFAEYMWRGFFGIGLGPGILGLILLIKSKPRLGVLTFIYFIFHALFFIYYKVVDKETMYLPNLLIWSLWIGVGLDWLFDTLREGRDNLGILSPDRWLKFIIVGWTAFSIIWNWPLADLSNDWSARESGEEILVQVEENAIVIGYWDSIPTIEYLQNVENKRPDVLAINRFLIAPNDMVKLIEQELPHRPIYIDSLPANLPENTIGQNEGLIYRLKMQ